MKNQSINDKDFTLKGEKEWETNHCTHNSQELLALNLLARKKLTREFKK